MKSPLEQFDIVNVKIFNTTLVDISLNNILIPFYVQNIIEKEFTFIIGLVKQQAHNYGLF